MLGGVSLAGRPPVRGPAVGDAALTSRREPLAGPGPDSPVLMGTPVSATVGVIAGTAVVGFNGSGATIGIADELVGPMLEDEASAKPGAGERLRLEGLIGGDWLFAGGGDAGDSVGFLSAEGRTGVLWEGTLWSAGGVMGKFVRVASDKSEFILDSSLAWVSPKLRVSDRLRSEPAEWGGRLI